MRPLAVWAAGCRFTLITLLVLVASPALADKGSVRAELDVRKMGVEDTTTLSVTLEGDAAGLDAALPSLKNLIVIAGPSTSTQISFINGSMSRQKIFSFVLRPEHVGPAEVGPVSVQGYPPTAPVTLEVVSGSIRPDPPQDPFGRDPFGGRDPFEEIFGRPQRRPAVNQGKLFVEATLSRPAARVGEPILVTYFVYTQISLSGVEFVTAPKYPGFWTEELERTQNDSTGENIFIQGESFLRYPVLERLLFPTKSGLLEIPEARLRLAPSGGAFGVAAPIERSTKALRVKVDALPQGAPEGSAVGSYEVEATADPTEMALGDAFTFRFKVKGRGNLKWIDAAPKLEIASTRVFPPRVVSELRATRQGIEGSKTWEFVVVPEKAGAYEIPPIPFAYFDSASQSMKSESTRAIVLAVSDGSPTVSGEGQRQAGPVALRADLDTASRDLTGPASAMALLALAFQAYAWRRRSTVAPGPGRSRHAIAQALRELQGEAVLQGTKERAAARIAGALEAAFGPRTEWPSDDLGDHLRSLSDDLEFLRFAPQLGSYEEKVKEVRDRAAALLEAQR